MSNITVGLADASQYDELMEVLDASFSFEKEHDRFLSLLPKLYRKEYRPWENNICVFEDGKIRAAVGLYYAKYHVCGDILTYGGIGNVGVLPESRGNGYMKLALNAAVEKMIHDGIDFGVLDGQRQRYRYFGFDNAGACYVYRVTKTNLRHAYGAERKTGVRVAAVTASDQKVLDYIYSCNLARDMYTERDRATLYDLLLSWRATPYQLLYGDQLIGYFVLSADGTEVREFTLTDDAYLDQAVIAVVDHDEAPEKRFSFAPYQHMYCDFFFGICDWMDIAGSCKLSIYHYEKVISAFLKAKALEHPLQDGSFTCLIHGMAGDEKLEICCENGLSTVQKTVGTPDFVLSHVEAENFFFANHSKHRRQLPHGGAGTFPLPFFLLSQDHV